MEEEGMKITLTREELEQAITAHIIKQLGVNKREIEHIAFRGDWAWLGAQADVIITKESG
jgi:hypothetical protein